MFTSSSQLKTLEVRESFRRVTAAVKSGTLSQQHIEDLLRQCSRLELRQDRVSVLRFALRIARRGRLATGAIVEALRFEYGEAAAEESVPEIVRRKLSAWSSRYGDGEPSSFSPAMHTRFGGTMNQLAEQIAEGDWDFWFNRTSRSLECWTGRERLFCAVEGDWSPFNGTLLAQVSEGTVVIENRTWKYAGKTHVGVPNGNHNDDAIGICPNARADHFLAVADGTGDSQFGSRASAVALQGLIDSWSAGVSLEWAIKLAASKLRADNLAHLLDGACTLSACVLHHEYAELVAVGDAFFICTDTERQVHKSVFDKESRSVLGGEPLGLTITSSGRLVENLDHATRVEVVRVDRVHRVLLGSDGACTPSLNESLDELTAILGGIGSAMDIAERIVSAAQDRSRATDTYDNISAVVALRYEM